MVKKAWNKTGKKEDKKEVKRVKGSDGFVKKVKDATKEEVKKVAVKVAGRWKILHDRRKDPKDPHVVMVDEKGNKKREEAELKG